MSDLDTVFEQVYDDGIWCERDCRFLYTWSEHHPYGMGTAAETLSECRCPDARGCPGVQDWIREHGKEAN